MAIQRAALTQVENHVKLRVSLKCVAQLHDVAVAHAGHDLLLQYRMLHVHLGVGVLEHFLLLHDLKRLLKRDNIPDDTQISINLAFKAYNFLELFSITCGARALRR